MVLGPSFGVLQKKGGPELRFYFPSIFPGLTMRHQSPGRQTLTSSAQGVLRLIFLELQWVCRKTHPNFLGLRNESIYVSKERSISSVRKAKVCSPHTPH